MIDYSIFEVLIVILLPVIVGLYQIRAERKNLQECGFDRNRTGGRKT